MDNNSIVIIGHCCLDKIEESYILGGSASYINAILNARNKYPTLITSFASDFPYKSDLIKNGSKLIIQDSMNTTIYQNHESSGGRKQLLLSKASAIKWHEEYKDLEPIDILFIGPIADEVDFKFHIRLEAKLKIATIQGWLRKRQKDDTIIPKWIDPQLLSGLDMVIFSVEDCKDFKSKIKSLQEFVPIVIVTNGVHGAYLFLSDNAFFFPSCEVNVRDVTGAGDSFACGLALNYIKSYDIMKAMIYAHATAGVVVENAGVYYPNEKEVEEKVKLYKRHLIQYI